MGFLRGVFSNSGNKSKAGRTGEYADGYAGARGKPWVKAAGEYSCVEEKSTLDVLVNSVRIALTTT